MKNIQNYLLTILYIVLCAGFLIGQPKEVPDLSQAMHVGDTFVAPKAIQLMRGNTKKIDWKKLENKVILLDFFETSCGTCIQTMPKLQKLKEQYPGQFEVIVVTWQDKVTMEKFFASNEYLKEHQVNLPVIYGDTYLKGLFPHRMVPHAVLLYKGKVQAITTSGFVNTESVLKLHREGSIDLPLKDDFGKRDLLGKLGSTTDNFKLGTLITGYQNGVPYRSWTFEQDSTMGLYKSSMYNTSIFAALKAIASKANMQKTMYIPRMDRVVWRVKDSTKYYDFEGKELDWRLKNTICYERFDKKPRIDSMQALVILNDFVNYYGLKVYTELREMKVLVLDSTIVKHFKPLENKKAMTYRGTAVFAGFTDYSEKFPPMVDKVKSDVMMEIYPYDTLEELNVQLAAYGMKAEQGFEEIEVLVIEEID
ncbi:TlpA family protein disulfide reductase [Sphingobacterium faecium]|uniref:TlpA family protein disulfide reductase n=1 Tax=Sphingobacterium faecium TaxID=34087 RepID=UPI002469984D|nr:TlpA disulfide reductase family protein [Sphingobacterium faecium]MDH5825852.1 TlpA disulfide reductase family protein [Sphingobacterium faecium]